MPIVACIKCGKDFDHCGCPGKARICDECGINDLIASNPPQSATCGRTNADLIKYRDLLLISKMNNKIFSEQEYNKMIGIIFSAINLNAPCMTSIEKIEDKIKSLI